LAASAYVASDMADVSFGVEAAARQFDLDFIRLLTEDYVFVCLRQMLETAPMKRVLAPRIRMLSSQPARRRTPEDRDAFRRMLTCMQP
jgi:molybdate-binding protein